ncbi:hypothetical protein PTSG_05321, partial [Salpingoeca rosetta]
RWQPQTGKANAKKYFEPLVQQDPQPDGDQGDLFSTTFRGRSIKGCQVQPPKGMKALHLQPTTQTQSDIEERTWAPVNELETLTMWKLESHPQSNDAAVTWPQAAVVAEEAHAPMTSEAMEELEAFHKQQMANGSS